MAGPWDKRPPRAPRAPGPRTGADDAPRPAGEGRPPRQPHPGRERPWPAGGEGNSARPPRAGAPRAPREMQAAGERPWPGASGEAEGAAPVRPARREEVRLYGLNAINAVHARRPEAIRKLYLLQSRVHALRPLLAWCVQNRVGYRVVEEEDLDRLAASSHHEGVVADVLRQPELALSDWLDGLAAGAPALAIWLDGVGNPHNFGAILRSAAHFGAAVLLPAASRLALSGAAARVAEGGAEAVPLVRLPPNDQALARLHEAGFVSAATVVREGGDLFALPPSPRLVYVMGAEGEGMDPGLARACSHQVSIPGTGAVESLNVAAATAVFLAHWAAARR